MNRATLGPRSPWDACATSVRQTRAEFDPRDLTRSEIHPSVLRLFRLRNLPNQWRKECQRSATDALKTRLTTATPPIFYPVWVSEEPVEIEPPWRRGIAPSCPTLVERSFDHGLCKVTPHPRQANVYASRGDPQAPPEQALVG